MLRQMWLSDQGMSQDRRGRRRGEGEERDLERARGSYAMPRPSKQVPRMTTAAPHVMYEMIHAIWVGGWGPAPKEGLYGTHKVK